MYCRSNPTLLHYFITALLLHYYITILLHYYITVQRMASYFVSLLQARSRGPDGRRPFLGDGLGAVPLSAKPASVLYYWYIMCNADDEWLNQ